MTNTSSTHPVQRISTILIAPGQPTPLGPPVLLSPLDCALLHSKIELVYIYRPTPTGTHRSTRFMPTDVLLRSLALTLNDYHVMAGRVVLTTHGERGIKCSDEGIACTLATSEATVNDLLPEDIAHTRVYDCSKIPNDLVVSLPSVLNSSTPLVQLQITRMKCGGVCIGISTYHGILDGESIFMFMQSWSHAARSIMYVRPSHDRLSLSAMADTHPRFPHHEYHIIEKPASQQTNPLIPPTTSSLPTSPSPSPPLSPPPTTTSPPTSSSCSSSPPTSSLSIQTTFEPPRDRTVLKMFYFSREDISNLKLAASFSPFSPAPSPMLRAHSTFSPAQPLPPRYSSSYISSLEVVCARVWQSVAEARCPSKSVHNSPVSTTYTALHRTSTGSVVSHLASNSPSPMSSPSSQNRASLYHGSQYHLNAYHPSQDVPEGRLEAREIRIPTSCYIAFSGRNRLNPPLPDVYCGCATFFAKISNPLVQVAHNDLANIAQDIKKGMDIYVDDYLRSILAFINQNLRKPTCHGIVPAFNRDRDLMCVAWCKFPVYDADFGGGFPTFVGFVPDSAQAYKLGYCAIMNTAQQDGSLQVALCLKESEMNIVESLLRLPISPIHSSFNRQHFMFGRDELVRGMETLDLNNVNLIESNASLNEKYLPDVPTNEHSPPYM